MPRTRPPTATWEAPWVCDALVLRLEGRLVTTGTTCGRHYQARWYNKAYTSVLGEANSDGEKRGGHFSKASSLEGGTTANLFALVDGSANQHARPAHNWGLGCFHTFGDRNGHLGDGHVSAGDRSRRFRRGMIARHLTWRGLRSRYFMPTEPHFAPFSDSRVLRENSRAGRRHFQSTAANAAKSTSATRPPRPVFPGIQDSRPVSGNAVPTCNPRWPAVRGGPRQNGRQA